jgi:hypothetical protein
MKVFPQLRHPCPKTCGKTFTRAVDAKRHAEETKTCGGIKKAWVCIPCGADFSRKDGLKRHQGLTDGPKARPQAACTPK